MRGCLAAHRLPQPRTFRRASPTPRRGARAWLCPAPCAGCRAPRRGRGRCAGAGASATRSRGAARLEGHKQHLPPARAHEKARWPDGAGAGSQGGVQWPGTLSTMAVASRARELLGLALLSAAAVRGRARGAGAIHVSVLVSSSRTYAHRMCSLARAKTKPLTTGGQT